MAGEAHNGMVTSVVSAGESIVSVGFDDTLREVSADGKSMTYVPMSLLTSKPTDIQIILPHS